MALNIKNFETKFGIICPNAYAKINYISGNNTFNFSLVIYTDEESRKNNKEIVDQKTYNFKFNLNSKDNIYIQAYNFLKSLDDFKNAMDC